jgi:hypothetical protein
MRIALSNTNNPADASVEAILPGVHDRLAAIQNSVDGTRTTLTERISTMCADLKEHVNELNTHTRLQLASHFATVATNLVLDGRTGDKVDKVDGTVLTQGVTRLVGGRSEFERVQGHRMTRSPLSITSLYEEYYGMNHFSGIPIEGGIAAAERVYKTSWRKHYFGGEIQHFSRMQRIVKAVDDAVRGGNALSEVLEQFDLKFQTELKSLSRMVTYLKKQGAITSKASATEAGSSL